MTAERRLHVGIVVPGFAADELDPCIPVQRELAAALSASHDVDVFPLRYPPHANDYTLDRVRVHPVGASNARRLGRVRLLFDAWRRIRRTHEEQPFDVLHGMWIDEPGFVAVGAARRLGIPAVVSAVGGELARLPDLPYGGALSWVNRALTRHTLRNANRVLFGCRQMEQAIAPWADARRREHLPLGVDHVLFSREGPREPAVTGRIKLLHVASLVPVKDQRVLLAAVAAVSNALEGVRLHIVGEGPLGEELVELARALRVDAVFHGQVARSRLPAFYRAADLCLLTSRHEGQGMVTLEAAACGRVTLGTRVGLLPDLDPTTSCPAPGDAEGLALEIRRTLARPDELRRREAEWAERVQREYTLELMAARLTALYSRVRARGAIDQDDAQS